MCEKMKWERLLVEKRFGISEPANKENENGRSQFEKDIDKITFSSAFRRLGRKTQVHLLSKNDHIHTRLSHSLEVASVGRSLGVMVGQWLKDNKEKKKIELPEKSSPSKVGEIVEAACLAHDIGNPPFGHAAEDAIRKYFQEANLKSQLEKEEERWDLERFDGNAMAFRIVTYKEYPEENGGMRLTYPTLGALLKYPWTSHFAKNKDKDDYKFSCFKTEYNSLCEVAKELNLIEKTRDKTESKAEYARHPLSYLVEAADDICYRVLDIEDAMELKLLPQDEFDQEFRKYFKEDDLSKEQQRLLDNESVSWSIKNRLLRGNMIGLMIKEIVEAFEKNYDTIIEGNFESSLLSKTNSNSLCLGIKALYKKENFKEKIYRNQRNVPLELGAYSVMKTLLENSTKTACEIVKGEELSYKTKILLKFIKQDSEDILNEKSLYRVIILFLDHVTGMTDNYATYINKQLLGLGN